MGGAGAAVLPAVEKVSPRANFLRPVSLPSGLGESVRPYFSAVPLAHATVRKISLPGNGKPRGLVFHILDVHRNLDAQTNIAHTVTSLIGLPQSSAIAMVGLEGAFETYDLSWLRSFPDIRGTRLAAEDLLAQDKMSGPMFSLLTAPTAIPPVIGIDDESHYHANLSAYRRSLASKQVHRGHVEEQIAQLQREKVAAFNGGLKAFDEIVQGYHRGTVSLGAYTRALAQGGGPPLGKPLALFLQALEKEETLDFKKVERERAHLLESLAQKMSVSQTNELISRSMAYRAGQLGYGDFYRWIKTLCDEVDVPLTRFPAMSEYIHYVLLAETIDAEDLLSECRLREKDLFHRLTKTDGERILIARSHVLTLVEKLLDFSLTPDEWADYEQVRGRGEAGIELEPYESFYQEAHARDGAMADNFLGAIEKFSTSGTAAVPVSIIVTGGYHGPGLNEKLTQAGMAVVTVVPKIEKIDTAQGSSYLTVFAQEKTPLDKLFEGAKLFVSDAPLPKTTAALQAAGAAMVSQTTGESFPPKTLAFLKKHFQSVSVVQNDGISEITLALFAKKFTVRYDPSQPMGKKIQAGQPSDPNFIQKWLQSKFVDGRLLTIGSALLVAGVWLFIAGPTTLHQMGPLVSAIGLLTILHNRTPGGRWVTQPTAVAPVPARVDPSPIQMAAVAGEGRAGLDEGGKEALPSRQPGDPWMGLSDIPQGFLRGRTVIVRFGSTNEQNTIKYLVDAGAKVVLILNSIATGEESGDLYDVTPHAEQFERKLNKKITVLKGEGAGAQFRLIGIEGRKHIGNMQEGDVVCLQDPRLDSREKSGNPYDKEDLARDLATLGQNALYVYDGVRESDQDDATVAFLPKFLPGVKGMSQTESENPALSGWDPAVRSVVKGEIDLKKDPTFWTRLLTNPLYKGFVFYFDQPSGSYEIYSRENHPGDLADHPDDEISELFRIQHRVNVPWGARVGSEGIPETSHFFLTHADHKPLVIVFPKSGGDPVVSEGYSKETIKAMETARFVVVHNPDRAKRPGRDSADQTKEQAEKNPGMKVLAPQYIYDHYPMEMWLTWTSPDGQIYLKTANLAGYIPNDPYGNPLEQVDHTTMSHASNTSHGELMAPWAIQDSLNAFFNQGKSEREKIRVTGNGWYYGDFSAGASQNILHNHLVRLVLLIERAGRTIVGREGGVTVGHLNDNEDARATYFEISSKDDLPALVKALEFAYRNITQKSHSFNFIIAPNGEHGVRVFVGDKIAGVPAGQFPNPSAFAEFGLVFIVDNPVYAFNLTEDQVEELKATDNVAEWVINNWKAKSITLREDLEQKCAKSIDLVSAPKQDYKNLAQEVLGGLRALQSPELDSLLSRILKNKSTEAKASSKKLFWTMAKATNDFVAAPIYETALFFFLPAMSGSVPILMVGVLIFVGLHYWDDYQGGKSSGLSPPVARREALRKAFSRFWRATILYAMPFALFMVPSELIPLLQQIGFGFPIAMAQTSSLPEIAGVVALLHSIRNLLKNVSVAMINKFQPLALRRDTPLLVFLFGLPTVVYASNLVVDPSLPFLFLAGLPWPTILGVLVVAAGVLGGVFLFSRAVSRSGGQESDELDVINRILGSGLPHWKEAEYLLIIAKETENEVVARAAVLPLIAPWRNLSIELDSTIQIFKDRGWNDLVREISSAQADRNPDWLSPLAEKNANRIGSVVFLRKPGDLAREQDYLVRYLLDIFPNAHRFKIEQLGSPGLNQINNIGLDLKNPLYEAAFKEHVANFYAELKMNDPEDVPSVPTVNQSLARLRKFAARDVNPGSDENKVPAELEVYTMADIEIARETIRLLQTSNQGEEIPVCLLLAGVDQETVDALKTAAGDVANVAVAESPVATRSDENGPWNLDTSSLNSQFEGLKASLGIGDDFTLEVSLSETISVDRKTLESQVPGQFNEALKQALLRFILNEARPFHFNTMLKIIQAIKQSA